MKMKGMGHIALNTGNFNESLKFYKDILGLEEERTTDWGEFKMTSLLMPDGGSLEIFDYGMRFERAPSQSSVGYRHVAFLVEDVDEWYRKLVENGIETRGEPMELPVLGIKGFICIDPDGMDIEIYETLNK